MEEYIPILKRTKLFSGVADEEIPAMARCLQMRSRSFPRGACLYRAGDPIRHVAILTRGSILVQKDDYWGNRSIVSRISPGEIFGESYALQDGQPLLNDVVAVEDSVVLLFDARQILSRTADPCEYHEILIRNLLQAIAGKNRNLAQKIDYMAQRTTRQKLTAYLSAQSQTHKSPAFRIPFNRQQLADFLGVDRSAMSAELCKMRDEGMLTFCRSQFVLHTKRPPL